MYPQLQAKYVCEVLFNRLVKLSQEKSVVMLTDRPDMTIAVDWDIIKPNRNICFG